MAVFFESEVAGSADEVLSVEITTQQVQLCVSSEEAKGWVLVLPWSRDQCGRGINPTTLLAEHQFNVVNDGLDD